MLDYLALIFTDLLSKLWPIIRRVFRENLCFVIPQFPGLSDCQSPHPQRLDFLFNASLTSLNLAKYQAYNCH